MKTRSILVITLMLALLSAPAILADPTILAGDDLWFTPAGGGQLTGVSIPAGFFCGGTSAAMTLPSTSMQGSPLLTSPDLTPVDTVIERPKDAPFVNNVAMTTIRIQALLLTSVNSVSINCGTYSEFYTVYVGLDPQPAGNQPDGTITIRRNSPSANGGRFDASFDVLGRAFFVNDATGKILGPVSHAPQTVTTVNACWSHTPGPGAFVSVPFALDTDTDFVLDTLALGTSNFFPGWCANGGAGPVPHTGPHPETCSSPSCPPGGGGGGGCDPVVVDVINANVIKSKGLNVEGAAVALARVDASEVTELTAFRIIKCAEELGTAMFLDK